MFALLGEITFETLTSPDSFRFESEYHFAEHKVVEAPPRLQWLANELRKISLDLTMHVSFVNPKRQMDRLRSAAEDHQARALVFGNGVHLGYYVIEKLEETHQQLADDGSYIAISARVELHEWIPGADFDPAAPPRRSAPPPGVIHSAVSPSVPPARAAAFDPSRPIGPHNLLPVAAIVQLSRVGAGPGVTYSPADYAQPGVSGVVSSKGGSIAPSVTPANVPGSVIVRAG